MKNWQCRRHDFLLFWKATHPQCFVSVAPNATPQTQSNQGFWWGGRPQQQINPVPGNRAQLQPQTSAHPTEAEVMNHFRTVAIKALTKRLTVSLEAHGSKIAAEGEELIENQGKLQARTAEIEQKVQYLLISFGLAVSSLNS